MTIGMAVSASGNQGPCGRVRLQRDETAAHQTHPATDSSHGAVLGLSAPFWLFGAATDAHLMPDLSALMAGRDDC